MSAFTFPALLRRHRHEARFSQLDLALRAGVSQRHVSFLECARAKPGRAVAARLAEALALDPHTANALLAAAGFAPTFIARAWNDAAMAPLRHAARHVLKGHMPYPAVLLDDAGDILDENPAFARVLTLLGDVDALWRRTHGEKPRNLLRLAAHPRGLAPALVNFEEVTRATLQRAIAEAPQSPRLQSVLAEIAAYPNVDPVWLKPIWGPPPGPIIEERYRVRSTAFGVFAVVTTLGAPMDITARTLRVEAFFPADEASKKVLTSISKG